MPVWLRKYYIGKINDALKKENQEMKKAQSKITKPNFSGFSKK